MHYARLLFLVAAPTTLSFPSNWVVYNGQNAVPHCPNTCTSTHPPFRCLGLFPGPSATPCIDACISDATCSQVTWAADDGRCFTRADGLWNLTSGGTVAACNNNTVPGCLPPPPANSTVITVEVSTTPLGVPMHPLAPAVTLDGWNGTLFPKWGNGSYLALDLRNPDLIRYASALAPAILRLGGSPEDSIEYTLDGSGCVPGSGGNGPAPEGYYCSQVHPYYYGCLTGARWEELLTFANTTGLSIVLGVNGCSGRMSRDTPMDFSNIKALLAATAASPHRGSLIGLELSNEVFNNTISPAAWGQDMDTLKGVVIATLGGPLAVMAGPDDASPTHLSQALNSTQKGTLTAMTYHHYPGCEANTSDYFVLEPLCLQIIDDWGVQFSNAAGAPAGIATWAG